MTPNQGAGKTRTRIFKGSQYWIWNTWGAIVGGLALFVFMQGEIRYALRFASDFKTVLAPVVWELLLLVSLLVSWPGNMIAIFPYEVVVEEGKGVRLHAFLKQVYIPIEDIRDIRKSFLQGYVVHLRRRHRLLRKFVIHRLFGREAEGLVHAIQDEIRRTGI